MTSDEFRSIGHALIDYIADYRDDIEQWPVLSQAEPGTISEAIAAVPPEHGEDLSALIDDLDGLIAPALTHWQSPGFFAYFPSNASYPSVLGELLSAGFGVQGMIWATSPAATELEMRMLDWLLDLCDLPRRFHSSTDGGGVILDSASSALLTALVAARHSVVGHGPAPELRAYTSTQAHSSVQKGMRVAGFADEQLRLIDTTDDFAMDAQLLAEAIAADREAGLRPFFVAATAGTTSSCAFDPVAEIAEICGDVGAWLHVDGAYAGSAAVAPELRFVNAGLERCDSYAFNAHKWLLTNFDASLFYVADRAKLVDALSIVPEYLRNPASESGTVIDYRDWQIPLGRRFRALKLWLVIRWYGAEGLRAHIRDHVALAQELASKVEDHPRFELLAPPALGLVCLAHVEGDERTRAILDSVNAQGRHYVTHTELAGRFALRVAIGSERTQRAHVDALWKELVGHA